jgi:hypothetical protein
LLSIIATPAEAGGSNVNSVPSHDWQTIAFLKEKEGGTMPKNRRLWIVGLILIISLTVAAPASLAYLGSRAETIIKIAYMNGYIAALEKDPETIEKMKKDREFLKNTVEKAAENYLDVVRKMNL